MPKDVKDLKQMFLQKKPCMILLAAAHMDKPYVSVLMKEADTTFAHTTNILSDMEAYGLIKFVAEGRVKYVKLTTAGKDLARSLKSVNDMLEGKKVQKNLKKLDIRLSLLEASVKADNVEERSYRKNLNRFTAIVERLAALEKDAALYDNPTMNVDIAHFKERFDYLRTKFDAPPQGTLSQWADN